MRRLTITLNFNHSIVPSTSLLPPNTRPRRLIDTGDWILHPRLKRNKQQGTLIHWLGLFLPSSSTRLLKRFLCWAERDSGSSGLSEGSAYSDQLTQGGQRTMAPTPKRKGSYFGRFGANRRFLLPISIPHDVASTKKLFFSKVIRFVL